MGIGNNKSRTKNSMKDFIVSTLNKNKTDGCYVVKKGGPPKPQPSYAVNERGHLVNPSTLEPISTKVIKSGPNKPHSTPATSSKQIKEANHHKPESEKELLKKRDEVVEKMKGKKAEKKKDKPLNNRDLV